MIQVTTLKGVPFYLNSDLIYKIEQVPDTMVVLVDGKTVWVKESPEVVIERIRDYQRSIRLAAIRIDRMEDHR